MAEASPTIFALSSAPGRAGIAVVRISGPQAGPALVALGGRTDRPRQAILARLGDPRTGAPLDRALTLWFRGPHSVTGEDVAELHLHGGRAVIDGVLAALAGLDGLAPAGPGDFTRRAFANNRLDLTEVEGLADLIAAETEAQRVQALRQAEGALSARYDEWRGRLVRSLAYIETEIDFTDQEIPEGTALGEREAIARLAAEIEAHLADGRRGERLRDGFQVVIAGPPNAGKSSLLNALARRDVAIVAPEPGTTRDAIEVALDIGGYPVVVCDTAGLREAEGAVEAEGVRRARDRMRGADLVVWLRDAGLGGDAPPAPEDERAIAIWSKVDTVSQAGAGLGVSSVSGAGISALVDEIGRRAASALDAGAAPALTRHRHRQSLERTAGALRRALDGDRRATELVAEELRAAAHELGRITGRVDVEDLLDVIFADFCIGK